MSFQVQVFWGDNLNNQVFIRTMEESYSTDQKPSSINIRVFASLDNLTFFLSYQARNSSRSRKESGTATLQNSC